MGGVGKEGPGFQQCRNKNQTQNREDVLPLDVSPHCAALFYEDQIHILWVMEGHLWTYNLREVTRGCSETEGLQWTL